MPMTTPVPEVFLALACLARESRPAGLCSSSLRRLPDWASTTTRLSLVRLVPSAGDFQLLSQIRFLMNSSRAPWRLPGAHFYDRPFLAGSARFALAKPSRSVCAGLDLVGLEHFPMATAMASRAQALFAAPRRRGAEDALRPGGGTDCDWQRSQLNIYEQINEPAPCFAVMGQSAQEWKPAAGSSIFSGNLQAAISMPTAIHLRIGET